MGHDLGTQKPRVCVQAGMAEEYGIPISGTTVCISGFIISYRYLHRTFIAWLASTKVTVLGHEKPSYSTIPPTP